MRDLQDIFKMKKSHLVIVWLGLMLCLSAFMLTNVGTGVRRRKSKADGPTQSLAKLSERSHFANEQGKHSRPNHQTLPAAMKRSISEPPTTVNSAKRYFSLPTNESIASWRANPTVNEWKNEWRTKVTTGPPRPRSPPHHEPPRTARSRPPQP